MVRRIPIRLKYARNFPLSYSWAAACRRPQPSGESSPRIILGSGPAPDHPPPFCSGSVLTGPDIGAVHEADIPLHPAGGVGLPLHFGQDSLPQPLLPPAVKPAGCGAPRAVAFRQGAPGSAGAQHSQDAVDDGAMVFARPSRRRLLRRQQRVRPLPLLIAQVSASHSPHLIYALIKPCSNLAPAGLQTRSSSPSALK